MKRTVCMIVALVAVVSSTWLDVAVAETNTFDHMTTKQKVNYAKQLRDARFLGAALDTLILAVEDLLPKETSSTVIHQGPITNKLLAPLATNRTASNYPYEAVGTMIKHGTLTNIVKQLVAEGHVCTVIGHKWQHGCSMPGCLVLHTKPIRHCLVCGETQTQDMSEWK